MASGGTISNFTYDPFGNLQYKFEPNSSGGLQGLTYTYDPNNHYTLKKTVSGNSTLTYTYDNAGNMTTWGGADYNYDANGLLDRLHYSSPMFNPCYRNKYDAFGGRAVRTQYTLCESTAGNLFTQKNYVSPDYEANSKNTQRDVYVTLGGSKIAKVSNGVSTTWLHHDHLGSTTMTTNSSGQSTDTANYNIFGQIRSGKISATNYLYTGQEWDVSLVNSASGQYYYKSRFYDPSLGRFTSPDSLIPNAYDSQAFASYNYVGNNPVNYTDPSGHVRETEIFNTLAWLLVLPYNDSAREHLECLHWMYRLEHALGRDLTESIDPAYYKWCELRRKREFFFSYQKKAYLSQKTMWQAALEQAGLILRLGGGINTAGFYAAGGLEGIAEQLTRNRLFGIGLIANLLQAQENLGPTGTTTTTTTAANIVLLPLPQPQLQLQPQPQPQGLLMLPPSCYQLIVQPNLPPNQIFTLETFNRWENLYHSLLSHK
jgi:RHS repeat-associated protein